MDYIDDAPTHNINLRECIACGNTRSMDNMSFHVFPSDEARRNVWLKAIGREDLKLKLMDKNFRPYVKICRTHFEQRHIYNVHLSNRIVLSNVAVPTLNIENKKYAPYPGQGGSISKENTLKTKAISEEEMSIKTESILEDSTAQNESEPEQYIVKEEETIVKTESTFEDITAQNESVPEQYIVKEEETIVKTESTFEDITAQNESVPEQYIVKEEETIVKTESIFEDNTAQNESMPEQQTIKTEDMSGESVIIASAQTGLKRPDENMVYHGDIVHEGENAGGKLSSNEKVLNKGLAQLVKWRELTHENQCNENLMLLTLSLHKTYPYVYQYTKNSLSLPTPIELRKFFLPFATEIDKRLINVLKTKANEMTQQGKICSISVDCIPVKQCLFYDISNDRIIGFSEVNGIQQLKFANYAVVVMAQGIIDDWQQLIAHCFLDDYDEHGIEVTDWVREISNILIEVGFDVRAFVTDPYSNIVTPKLLNAKGSFFRVARHEICRVFDTPSLIQCLRIHLNKCRFIYKDKVLTSVYLENKIENLEKILNYKEPKRSAINDTLKDELKMLQLNFLTHMLQLFKKLRLVDINSGIDVTATATFVMGFQVTIASILKLHERFKSEELEFRHTSRLTLDGIKKVFRYKKKKGSCQETTCRQISTMFRKTFLRNIMSDAGHDHVDLALLLLKIENYSKISPPLVRARDFTSLAVETTAYRLDLPDKQVISYISKHLYRICFDRHSNCYYLKSFLSKSKTIMNYKFGSDIDNHISGSPWAHLVTPDCFTDYIFLLEKKIQDYFNDDKIKNIANDVFRSIGFVIPSIPCRCFPFDYAAKLFIRFRIHYTIKMNNKMIKQRKCVNTAFSAFKLTNN